MAGAAAAASSGRAANRLRINFSFEFQPEGAARRQMRRIGAVQCNDRLRAGAIGRDVDRRAAEVEEAADMLAARDAIEAEQVALGDPVRVGAEPQRGVRRAQSDETAREIEQGFGVVLLPVDREVAMRGAGRQPRRSEEHTSELQSLMRTSYAVFCLKK